MRQRLSKIYTRSGDNGTTGIGSGRRVNKDHPHIEATGSVDELNSYIGLVRSQKLPVEIDGLLLRIQHELFDLGGDLTTPGRHAIEGSHVQHLEDDLDHYNSGLPELAEFILPAGGEATTHCHLACAVCRRTERRIHSAAKNTVFNHEIKIYLNRLSDLLFVVARVVARFENSPEVLWQPLQQE